MTGIPTPVMGHSLGNAQRFCVRLTCYYHLVCHYYHLVHQSRDLQSCCAFSTQKANQSGFVRVIPRMVRSFYELTHRIRRNGKHIQSPMLN